MSGQAVLPQLLDATAVQRAMLRLAHEIAERHPGESRLLLAGVPTRGVPLAARLAEVLASLGQRRPAVCALDLSAFRDDRPRAGTGRADAALGDEHDAATGVQDSVVIVVDDVMHTGRTVRAAIDAVIAQGRPAAVEILTLVDRGHRELPLRPTYVGKNVPTATHERVQVRLREVDGVDGAWLVAGAAA